MRIGLVLFLGVLPLFAAAEDITGVYQVQDGNTMTLHYRDADHLRMEMGEDQFMLVNDSKVYMVNRQGEQWTAMDMSSMGKMMGQMGMAPGKSGSKGAADPGDYSFESTGREETVAGYTGEVYEAVGPKGDRTEVVLSTHDDIKTLTRGWIAFSGKMMAGSGAASNDQLKSMMGQDMVDEMGGSLRVEGGMQLREVSKEERADSFYELPPGTRVQKIPSMGGGMSQRDQSGDAGKYVGAFLRG